MPKIYCESWEDVYSVVRFKNDNLDYEILESYNCTSKDKAFESLEEWRKFSSIPYGVIKKRTTITVNIEKS